MKDPRTGIGVGVGLGFEGVPRLFLVPLSGASVFSAWAGLGWAWVTGASFANKGLPVLVGVLDHRLRPTGHQ